MDTPVLSSTFFLTLLLMVGLFFFIRGSVKERIEQRVYLTSNSDDQLLEQLRDYFDRRSYQVKAIEPEQNIVRLQGFVPPSPFLAIFLTILAALGLFCFSLVLSVLFPDTNPYIFALVGLSPLAGVFYWQKVGRLEEVAFKVENKSQQTELTVKAHRDELRQLQDSLTFLERQ
ncbi:MAG: cofactor assembly of complex C subunit B [Microcystis aeruginosa Ma_MB_F_20061100_S20]|uniref:Cofactor assembly of complex C subunit B n=1 Tax=Microcystis aeruginosa Ma_MB_F_20061100_S20D TaxID=2486253 RepID=A0A552ETP6_MICAE|nr:MAG: cofactor assembly of complex C subunit B [Microcystis aeruginosa Ma_MB_F_20061100_S20D]TRU39873.1 MAG: cofactor assembly of complex C subunit B [Microcystis aeruginosa Ma_MB_F_20061100_S20]